MQCLEFLGEDWDMIVMPPLDLEDFSYLRLTCSTKTRMIAHLLGSHGWCFGRVREAGDGAGLG